MPIPRFARRRGRRWRPDAIKCAFQSALRSRSTRRRQGTSACRPATRHCPRLLKKTGYATALVGKWHLGYLPDFSPLKSGYDHFYGIFGGQDDYFNHGNKSPIPLYEQEMPVDPIDYLTKLPGGHAVQKVERYARGNEPFQLSLQF